MHCVEVGVKLSIITPHTLHNNTGANMAVPDKGSKAITYRTVPYYFFIISGIVIIVEGKADGEGGYIDFIL